MRSRLADRAEAVIFDLFLFAFTAIIVVAALDLGQKAQLVPLVIGIPTGLGLLALLALDLRRPAVHAAVPVQSPLETIAPAEARVTDLLAAVAVEEAVDELPTDPDARRRQLVLAVWAIGYVAAAIAFGFLVTTPIALVAILWFTTRSIIKSVVITAVASALLYLMFDTFLNVPF